MANVNRLLESIGKEIFVNHYYDFKDQKAGRDQLAQKLLNENPRAKSLGAQRTRISKAHNIFSSKLEREALEIIIQSTKLDEEVIKKAKEIIKKEFE